VTKGGKPPRHKSGTPQQVSLKNRGGKEKTRAKHIAEKGRREDLFKKKKKNKKNRIKERTW